MDAQDDVTEEQWRRSWQEFWGTASEVLRPAITASSGDLQRATALQRCAEAIIFRSPSLATNVHKPSRIRLCAEGRRCGSRRIRRRIVSRRGSGSIVSRCRLGGQRQGHSPNEIFIRLATICRPGGHRSAGVLNVLWVPYITCLLSGASGDSRCTRR